MINPNTTTSNIDLDSFTKGDSIFVLNRTKTDFNMHISDAQNHISIITIPRTFIPIDLTMWATVPQLKTSQEFRAALRGGVLSLISPKEAKAILSEEDGRIEHERIMNKLNIVSEDLLASANDNLMSSSFDLAAVGDMDDVNDQIRDIFANKDMPDADKLANIVALDKEDSLQLRDFEWIKSVANNCPSTLQYTERRIKELTGLLSR